MIFQLVCRHMAYRLLHTKLPSRDLPSNRFLDASINTARKEAWKLIDLLPFGLPLTKTNSGRFMTSNATESYRGRHQI